MAEINSFEAYKVLQKAKVLNAAICTATKNGKFAQDAALKMQLKKAAISVLAQITEGFEKSNRNEFITFLSIAKSSVSDLRMQLYLAHDQEYISTNQFCILSAIALQAGEMTNGIINMLNNKN